MHAQSLATAKHAPDRDLRENSSALTQRGRLKVCFNAGKATNSAASMNPASSSLFHGTIMVRIELRARAHVQIKRPAFRRRAGILAGFYGHALNCAPD